MNASLKPAPRETRSGSALPREREEVASDNITTIPHVAGKLGWDVHDLTAPCSAEAKKSTAQAYNRLKGGTRLGAVGLRSEPGASARG
jgi:hypothetical protein